MRLTDRDRRILAEMERQFASDESASPAQGKRARRQLRPQWTVVPSAVLGILLFAAGIALGVGGAVLVGSLLLTWWLSPRLWRLLRAAGRMILESLENGPPGTMR